MIGNLKLMNIYHKEIRKDEKVEIHIYKSIPNN